MLDTITASIISLRRDLDKHHRLLMTMREDHRHGSTALPESKAHHLSQREQLYRDAIRQTILILEESRKSFKSKQLGELRKQLMNVLLGE